jgi:hypothetical protein
MRRSFRGLVAVALPVALTMVLTISLASPTQAAPPRSLFLGDGYGSYSFVGQSAVTGRTAYVVLGCQTKAGTHIENATQSNQEEEEQTGGSMSTGSVGATADAIQNATTTKTLTTATTNRVNLLKGRITASRVRSVSATYTSGKDIRTSSSGSVLSDLVVEGKAVRAEPGPNTKITLAGLGYVVLNEQLGGTEGPMPFLVVNGIHVYVTEANAMGIPIGTQYVVAHAFSALEPSVSGVVGGLAFGHKLFEGGRAQSGPSAVVYMPCVGTGGKVVSNTMAGATHPKAFQLGTVKDTAMGRVEEKSATSQTTSSIQSVNLLSGLITADAIKAVATGTKNGNNPTFTDAGSKFVNLVVAGHPIGSETGPNRAIQLPGIGTLWLHRVIRGPNSIEVRMIDLEVKQENPFGLKPGSKLQIAVARAVVVS